MLIRRYKRLKWIGGLSLLAVAWLATSTHSYKACEVEHRQSAEKGKPEKLKEIASRTVFDDLKVFVQCEGAVIDANDALLAALATIAIAAYTVILADATRGLQRAAHQQQRDMRRSLDIAAQSANAARESADTAKDALHKLERPFLFIAGIPWEWHRDTGRPGRFWYSLHPNIENSGSTPTQELIIRLNRSLRETAIPDGFDFPFSDPGHPSLVGPKGRLGVSGPTFTDDDLLAIQRGEKFFYIWGIITYRDIFANTPVHTTRFCNQITNVLGNPLDPIAPGDATEKLTSVSFACRIHHEHNSAD